ncbi:MAG TPA: outer membrane protein transport protein [candidate division Zixibacteria bacterium]|nr:outer membrane protein transport protein [candidate division Zixibacteria bacterium]
MKKCIGVVAVLLMVMTAAVMAQDETDDYSLQGSSYQDYYTFDFTGAGARAQGMGNAFIAVSDDITAGTWNPAGLVTIEGPMLSLSYGSIVPKGYTDYSGTVISGIQRFNHDRGLSGVSDLCFVAPFRVKGRPFVGSFSYNTEFTDLYQMAWLDSMQIPLTVSRNNIAVTEDFDLNTTDDRRFRARVASATFSFGTRLTSRLAAGLGVNVYTGHGTTEITHINYIHDYPVSPGEQPVLMTEDYYDVDTAKYSGIGFTLGLKYTVDKNSLAMVIKTPFDLRVKTNKSIYVINSINGLPQSTGTDTTFYDDILIKYHMPFMVALGYARQVNENLLVSATAEYRAFSSSKVRIRESYKLDQSGKTTETFSEVDPEWDDVFIFRIGTEYMKQTSFGLVPIRAGFGVVPTPIPNLDGSPTRVDLSAGTGIHWSQIHLDWAYTYSMIDRDFETTGLEIKVKNHDVGFTFTGYF